MTPRTDAKPFASSKAAEHYLHGDGNVPANKRVLDHDSYREG
jgi:hypothetical protein